MMASIKRLCLVAVVLCLVSGATRPAVGAFVLNPTNGHYYGLTGTAVSFDAAEAEAVALGGHLVSIADQAEQDFLVATFLAAPQATAQPYWIGFTDAALEGTFVWTSGESVTYTNWNIFEPNNFLEGEDYAMLNWHFARGDSVPKGTWNDTPVNGSFGYGGNTDGPYRGIIELTFNPIAVPEPSTLLSSGVACLAMLGVAWRRRSA